MLHPQLEVSSRCAQGQTCRRVWDSEQITVSVLSELLGEVGSRVGKVGSSDP